MIYFRLIIGKFLRIDMFLLYFISVTGIHTIVIIESLLARPLIENLLECMSFFFYFRAVARIHIIKIIGSLSARPLNGRPGKVENFLSGPLIRICMFRVYIIFCSNVFFTGAYGDPEPGKEILSFTSPGPVHMSPIR
jgi:hypothetical protein